MNLWYNRRCTFPLGRSRLMWRRRCSTCCQRRRRGSCHLGRGMGCSSRWGYSFLLLVLCDLCIRSCSYNRTMWNNLGVRFHSPRRGFGRSVLFLFKGLHCRRCINNLTTGNGLGLDSTVREDDLEDVLNVTFTVVNGSLQRSSSGMRTDREEEGRFLIF